MSEATGHATIAVDCGDPDAALAVAAALAPDNDHYVQVTVDGSTLRVTVPDSKLGTLVRTVDDVLAGLTVAMDGARAGREAA